MKKNLKKVLSLAFAGALTATAILPMFGTTTVKAAGDTMAYLTFADNAWGDAQYWNDGGDWVVEASTAEVTGYGQYTVALDFSGTEAGKAADMAFLDVEISNGEEAYPNSFMTIDSVKINGEEVEVGATYTSSDDGVATRTNLYNSWVTAVEEGRTADGEIGDATATPIDGTACTDIETIEVTFTLGEGVAFGDTKEKIDTSKGFTAFLMFADGSGAWENYDQGVGTECTVMGDGVYEVSLTAEQCGAIGQAAATEEACVFLVDILGLASVLEEQGLLTENEEEKLIVSDIETKVAVFVDGQQISSKNKNIVTGDIEEKGTFRIDLVNAYDGAGTKENPVVSIDDLAPTSEIKVVFSLSGTGLNSDADTDLDAYLTEKGYVNAEAETQGEEEQAAVTAENSKEESAGISTGAIVAIVVVVAAVVIGVIVVVGKKKK